MTNGEWDFRSQILAAALSYLIASLGLLPVLALRFIVRKSLGRSWSANAVEATCSHLSQVSFTIVERAASMLGHIKHGNYFFYLFYYLIPFLKFGILIRKYLHLIDTDLQCFYVGVTSASFWYWFSLITYSIIPCGMSSIWPWLNSKR